MKIAVVIPAYNEAGKIAQVVREVRHVCPHVFVVDDGSADRTAEEAEKAGAGVFRHAVNRGQGAALQTGIAGALADGADIIMTFDADGQMSPSDIGAMAAPIISGSADAVLGTRFAAGGTGMPALRRLVLKAALLFTKATTGLKITDTHNGFRAFSRQAALGLDLRCDRMAHASEILEHISRRRLRYAEVPVTIAYTEYSLAKGQRLSGAWRIIRDLLISPWLR